LLLGEAILLFAFFFYIFILKKKKEKRREMKIFMKDFDVSLQKDLEPQNLKEGVLAYLKNHCIFHIAHFCVGS